MQVKYENSLTDYESVREKTFSVTIEVLSRSLVRDILGTRQLVRPDAVRKLSSAFVRHRCDDNAESSKLDTFPLQIECDHGLSEVQRSLTVSGGLYPILQQGT